jgi:hypothetical protein
MVMAAVVMVVLLLVEEDDGVVVVLWQESTYLPFLSSHLFGTAITYTVLLYLSTTPATNPPRFGCDYHRGPVSIVCTRDSEQPYLLLQILRACGQGQV